MSQGRIGAMSRYGVKYRRVIMMISRLVFGTVSLSRASKQRRRAKDDSHSVRETRASGLFNTRRASARPLREAGQGSLNYCSSLGQGTNQGGRYMAFMRPSTIAMIAEIPSAPDPSKIRHIPATRLPVFDRVHPCELPWNPCLVYLQPRGRATWLLGWTSLGAVALLF